MIAQEPGNGELMEQADQVGDRLLDRQFLCSAIYQTDRAPETIQDRMRGLCAAMPCERQVNEVARTGLPVAEAVSTGSSRAVALFWQDYRRPVPRSSRAGTPADAARTLRAAFAACSIVRGAQRIARPRPRSNCRIVDMTTA